MYLTELHYINVGPIDRADVTLLKDTDIRPRPIVFVGMNGSGKSILLSNIVDCFYEMARKNYNNVMQYREDGGYLYYKIVTQQQIKLGKDEMFSHIKFKQDNETFEYVYKRSKLNKEQYTEKYGIPVAEGLAWGGENDKAINISKEKVEDAFDKGVVCFFPPSRFTKPVWLGDQYVSPLHQDHYSVRTRYSGMLRNNIESTCETKELLQWIFDVLTDSKPDIEREGSKYSISYPETNVLELLRISKSNLESVFTTILGEEVRLRMLNRAQGENRLSIERKKDSTLIVPSLDSLSTGQLALLNIFGTIVRYADVEDLSQSFALNQIKGVIVIDEIELHLHAELQREVLPKLIKLFPLVQFIITSHSPLFLLGMQECFGDDGFDIYEMPEARKISAEQFSQFESAYRYFKETNKYQDEIREVIRGKTEKPLIITEGATDWRHIKAAMNELSDDPDCIWLSDAGFEFLEYDPENSETTNPIKLKMSSSELVSLCKEHSKIKQPRKLIFIADRDRPNDTRTLEDNQTYKNWGNNVFSFCLPIPEHRKQTPLICIEHYYSDEEIKKEVDPRGDGVIRRIYLGNEFDELGRGINIEKMCSKASFCGPGRINIIDGNGEAKVYTYDSIDTNNYALPKMEFAERILRKEAPFEHMDFSGFKQLFSTIRKILEEPIV